MDVSSLSEILLIKSTIKDKGITFIKSGDEEYFLSYNHLYTKALKVLTFLQSKGIRPGNELLFQIDDNEVFIPVFWACILGGIIPVPVSVGNCWIQSKMAEHSKKHGGRKNYSIKRRRKTF